VLLTWSASVFPQEKNGRPGPQQAVTLQLHQPIERETSGREKDTYQISLAEGRYVSLVLEGRSVDLLERVLDTRGNIKIQGEFNSGETQEQLGFVSEKTGVYRLEVSPAYPKAQTGKYRIRLASVRAATQEDLLVSKALELYSQSLELYRAWTYNQALAVGERALQIQRNALGDDHPEVARTLNLLGLISSGKGEYSTAQTLLQRALIIDEKAFGRRGLATAQVLDSLANNLSAQARYTDAENLAKEALTVREQSLGSDHLLVGASLGTLGDIYLAKTDYKTAGVFAARAQEVAAKSYGPDDPPYFDFVSRLGRVLTRQGNYPRAEQLILQALHAREALAGKDSLAFADSMADLGLLYLLERDNVRGDQTLREALALKEKILGPEHPQLAPILNNLGLIQYRRGDYATAESLHVRALAIREKVLGPTHPDVGRSLNNLGLVYWREGNYPEATKFYQRALEVEEKAYGPQSPTVAADLANLGIMAKETGHYDVAETYYLRALAIEEEMFGKQNPEVRVYVESLGILYRDEGDYNKAEPLFLRALAISEASLGKDNPDTARLLRNIRQLYSAKGDTQNALRYFQRIAAIDEANLPLNLAVGSERQKLAYFDSFSEELGILISFQVLQDPTGSDTRDLAASVLLQRKGRVLDASADNLGALRVRSSTEDRALLDQFKEVTSQLATLVLNGPQRTSPEDDQKAVQSLTDQRDRLEAELNRRSMGYYQVSSAVTLPAIQAAIPTNAALVEFSIYRPYEATRSFESGKSFGDPRYVAYVLTNHGDVRWRDLGEAKEIDALVTAFRHALQDPHRNDIKELSRSLDERVFRPLRPLLGAASHLLLSPDGQLDLVPFEALLDDRNRFLIEQYSVTYLSTGRDLLRLQVPRKSKSGPLLVADPSFGVPGAALIAEAKAHDERFAQTAAAGRSITVGDDLSKVYFAPLSGTAREARAIQSLFPEARVLSGPQATKAALKNINAPAILHIATHGFFLRDTGEASASSDAGASRGTNVSARMEDPLLRSGLALAGANSNKGTGDDGILTALEASNLNLWGTKLVTLSACDTGLGEVKNGEGVYGLRRAFFLAGTESLVMSLWPVGDYVTRELMTEYYAGLKKGLGRGEALRQAQLDMLKRGGRQHPFYWGSFIQAGEWANLDGQR
jgi:CHAT domain-containing protein/Tfp pilus assembly protein PilF